MKTLGLIGGLSWESTAEYYRQINEGVRDRLGGLHSAQLLLYSFDFAEIESLQQQGDWEAATQAMLVAAQRLQRGQADGYLICSNTMHRMVTELQQAIELPCLHIADATGVAIQAQGLQTVGLLGTQFTMEGDFYAGYLRQNFGLNVLIPNVTQRELVHRVIYTELCRGQRRQSSKRSYQTIIQSLADRSAEGLIFGCTEIGLLIQQADCTIPIFDTTAIHAAAAVDWMLS
ncbi:MAG: aspartate/glutamate racemase family protein [Cyanobacteria bacterium P01_H01_bin.121]